MEPVALSSVQCLFQFEIHCLPDFTLICKCHLRRSGENNLKWCKNKTWKKKKNRKGRVLQTHSENTSFGCFFFLVRIAELCTVSVGWDCYYWGKLLSLKFSWRSIYPFIYLSELSSAVSVISIISSRLNNQKKYNQNLKACMNACMCIDTVCVFVRLYKCRFYVQQMCRCVRLSPYFSPPACRVCEAKGLLCQPEAAGAACVYLNDTRCVSHHKRAQKSWMSRLYSPVPGRGVTFHY